MTDMFLDHDEIKGLTNKVQRSAQAKVLRAMGIEHKIRPDGSIAILRDHITKIFDGDPDSARRKAKVVEPNWSAI